METQPVNCGEPIKLLKVPVAKIGNPLVKYNTDTEQYVKCTVRGTWLAQLVKRAILDLRDASSSPMLGEEMT